MSSDSRCSWGSSKSSGWNEPSSSSSSSGLQLRSRISHFEAWQLWFSSDSRCWWAFRREGQIPPYPIDADELLEEFFFVGCGTSCQNGSWKVSYSTLRYGHFDYRNTPSETSFFRLFQSSKTPKYTTFWGTLVWNFIEFDVFFDPFILRHRGLLHWLQDLSLMIMRAGIAIKSIMICSKSVQITEKVAETSAETTHRVTFWPETQNSLSEGNL